MEDSPHSPPSPNSHSKVSSIASGYPWTPYRIEWRPTYGLPDRDEMQLELDVLQSAGVKGWWYSVAAKGSFPLFCSQYLPYRDDADDTFFQWLTTASRERGMSILSWEYLSTAPMLAAKKPEWRCRWFGHDGDISEDIRATQFVCYNSPYGGLLMDYCVEVVDHLGFDGIWFDGSTLFGVGTAKQLTGCRCAYCREKYKNETGEPIPDHIDLGDPTFRRYINWRNADFMHYWKLLSDHVYARAPGKLIVMNHFNRLTLGWKSGCPLLRSPMKAMISTEVGVCFNHLRLHHKYHRAINDNYPVEVWTYLRDGASQQPVCRPDPDPAAPLYLCRTAAACGGYMSFGLSDSPTRTRDCMRTLSDALAPLQPHIGGEPLRCVGLVLSGATKDFAYADPYEGWKHVHGANNLFEALHWPVDILLDNMFDRPTLDRYQVIVLPDTRCLGDEAAANLEAWVKDGGTLLAFGETATHDLNGDPRAMPALDALFGIERSTYSGGKNRPVGVSPDDLFGEAVQMSTVLNQAIIEPQSDCLRGDGLPAAYMIAGNCLPVAAAPEAEVLALTSYTIAPTGKRWSSQGLIPPEGETHAVPAIIARNHGKGRAIAIRSQLSYGYAEQPHRRSREVVRRLLADRVNPGFITTAPPDVVVAPWRRDGCLAIHLLQVPSALLRFVNDTPDLSDFYWPEEMSSTGPFTVTLPDDWQSAASPVHGPFQCRRTDAGFEVRIDTLAQHDVIVLS